MGQYFGTDGIRGPWDSALLNLEIVASIAHTLAIWLKQQPGWNEVMLAGDTRSSTSEIVKCIQNVLMDHGITVQFLGTLPSPGLAYMVRCSRVATLGIMVTASHNPASDNGIKLFGSDGCKLPQKQEEALDALMMQSINPMTNSEQRGTCTNVPATEYELLLQQQYAEKYFFKKIVVDAAHGAGCYLSDKLLADFNVDVIAIANSPNGANINHLCGATHPEFAQAAVVQNKADLGIVLDGDADRIILVDHEGNVVDGDGILFILAKYGQPEGVVGTLMSNYGLEKALLDMGIGFERTAVGDKHVMERLKKKNWPYGAESSGHVINTQLNPTGDGLLTAFQIMNIAAENNCSIQTLLSGYKPYPQVLINIEADSSAKQLIQTSGMQQIIDNAVQSLGDKGRVLVRASGTEPVIRVMVESETSTLSETSAKAVAQSIESML